MYHISRQKSAIEGFKTSATHRTLAKPSPSNHTNIYKAYLVWMLNYKCLFTAIRVNFYAFLWPHSTHTMYAWHVLDMYCTSSSLYSPDSVSHASLANYFKHCNHYYLLLLLLPHLCLRVSHFNLDLLLF